MAKVRCGLRYGNATAREPISKSGRYAGSAKLMTTPKVQSTPPLRILVVGAGVGGISVARGLLRDGHDVTVFEQRPDVRAGGGAVTIWSNGATVLEQLGVDMDGTGQLLSTLQVMTSTGHPITTVDLTAIVDRLGAPVRMVPRRVLLERLLEGFPTHRIRCDSHVVGVVSTHTGVRVDFEDGSSAEGDVLIGADGLHSMVRDIVGARAAEPTGWCSWQGLVTLPGGVADPHVALMMIGEHGNLGLWPAGGSDLQWWFDLPWSSDFVRPERPIDVIRSHFTGWSDSVDRVLARLTDNDLARSPFPHFRHPIPRPGQGALTLLGDAAHTMPPTLAQGTNQALLDTMVLCKALSGFRNTNRNTSDLWSALRWYEKTRRHKVAAVSRVASLQVSHGESALRPAAIIPDRLMTKAMTMFLRAVSHRRLSTEISRDLGLQRLPERADRVGRDELPRQVSPHQERV
jgi:FAD-dependent urate hydroxylase